MIVDYGGDDGMEKDLCMTGPTLKSTAASRGRAL